MDPMKLRWHQTVVVRSIWRLKPGDHTMSKETLRVANPPVLQYWSTDLHQWLPVETEVEEIQE
jgi:hypothetical protein